MLKVDLRTCSSIIAAHRFDCKYGTDYVKQDSLHVGIEDQLVDRRVLSMEVNHQQVG